MIGYFIMQNFAAKKEIPIFFATDNNYVPFLAVALTSLLDNASKDYVDELALIAKDA